MGELIDYSERRFRAALRAIPDGVYHGEDAVDDDGLCDQPLDGQGGRHHPGDTIAVDYAGTCRQVTRNLNCPWASTISATLAAIKSALTSPDIPFNEGVKRPITVTAPKGSLVNPNYPAPVRARMLPAYRCFNAVLKALAQVVPDRVIAGGNDSTHALAISHLGSKGYRVYLEIYGGGFGGGPRRRRLRCRRQPSLELHEHAGRGDGHGLRAFPHHRLWPAAGHRRTRQVRGGLGLFRRFLILKDGTNFATYTDRVRLAPYGLFGGSEGSRTRIEIERNGQVIKVKSKDRVDLRAGDILTLYSSGGGGYGPASERDPGLVAHDLAEGFISPAAANTSYGRIKSSLA